MSVVSGRSAARGPLAGEGSCATRSAAAEVCGFEPQQGLRDVSAGIEQGQQVVIEGDETAGDKSEDQRPADALEERQT
jgi:hypothetical protein